jgi:hypothetical protein
MQLKSIQDLIDFILVAKQVTYVGGGNKLLPYRLGSHDLQFFKDDWACHIFDILLAVFVMPAFEC